MLCALHGGTDHARSVLVTTESTYGARLRFWRDQARMSQAKLAAAAGMTERNIRHLETSAQRPYDDSHGRIAQALAPGLGWSDADLAEIRDRRCLPDLPVEGVSGQVAERGLSAEGVAGNGSGAATHGSALSGVATESYRTGGLSSRSLGPIPKRATPRVIDLTAAESLRLPPDAHSLPPGHAGARNRRRDFLRLALGVVVILISVSAAAATGRFDRGAHATTESARIQDPANRERVVSPLVVHGTAVVPPDRELWLMIQPPDGIYSFVQRKPLRVDAAGAWTLPMRVGRAPEDVGLAYDLYVVSTPKKGSVFERVIRDAGSTPGKARQETLPADTKVVARIRITLAGYHGQPVQ